MAFKQGYSKQEIDLAINGKIETNYLIPSEIIKEFVVG